METTMFEAGTPRQESRQEFERVSAFIAELERMKGYVIAKDPRGLTPSESHNLLRAALYSLAKLAIDPTQERSEVESLVERLRQCAGWLGTGRSNDVNANYELDTILADTQRMAFAAVIGTKGYMQSTGVTIAV